MLLRQVVRDLTQRHGVRLPLLAAAASVGCHRYRNPHIEPTRTQHPTPTRLCPPACVCVSPAALAPSSGCWSGVPSLAPNAAHRRLTRWDSLMKTRCWASPPCRYAGAPFQRKPCSCSCSRSVCGGCGHGRSPVVPSLPCCVAWRTKCSTASVIAGVCQTVGLPLWIASFASANGQGATGAYFVVFFASCMFNVVFWPLVAYQHHQGRIGERTVAYTFSRKHYKLVLIGFCDAMNGEQQSAV